MNLSELENMIKTNDFQDKLENYLLNEVEKDNYNPFNQNVTKEMILHTIIRCTVILASLIYLTNRKNRKGDI